MQQSSSSEQRSALIGILLIMAVFFLWTWQFSPAPQEQPPAGPDTTVAEQQAADSQAAQRRALARAQDRATPTQGQDTAAEAQEPTAAADSTILGALEGEERLLTVETELYEATFSTKGATLVSFELKKYDQYDQETPVELVSRHGRGALSLAFTTPSGQPVDTRSFFFEPQLAGTGMITGDTIRVAGDTTALTFVAEVAGGQIRQTYRFYPDEYEVGLQVAFENFDAFATDAGYELVWHGGVPFAEDHPETEAQNAGAYAYMGGELVQISLSGQQEARERLAGDIAWAAVRNKYFTAVTIPTGETRGAVISGEKEAEGPGAWEDYTTRLRLPAPEGAADAFQLYLGPVDYYRLAAYDIGLYGMVDYGWDWFEWMTKPLAKYFFIPIFTFLSSFIPNYGIVIILLAVIVKMLLYLPTKSSYKSMAQMRELQPRMEEIREKYGDDPQKQQQEMMNLYKETGVNPIGGCLPMLLQYPVIIALWMFLPTSIAIRQESFLWAEDLSVPDVILELPFTIPFYGDYVAGFTLLMGLSMIITMRLQTSSGGSAGQMKVLSYIFPFFIFFIFNRFAAALSLYYLAYNIMTAAQQQYINHQIESEKEEGGAGSNGKGSKEDAEVSWFRKLART